MAINQPAANSTLTAIQTKVRRITRSPSEAQLSDPDLNQYINTAVLYDFPETLRLFNLRKTLTFYTQPNVAEYSSTTNPDDPLYDFTNRYITIHPPVYVAGIQIQLSQSEQEFFGYWPKNAFITTIGIGDNIETLFSGNITNIPVLRNLVNITYIDALGNGIVLYDIPDAGTTITGKLFLVGEPVNILDPYGTINYVTGAFTLDLFTPPAQNVPIRSQSYSYVAARPNIMLFYDGKFQFRPVPDQSYKVTMEVYAQPAALLAAGNVPELSEWWQYISYLAAKKIFEDRMDMESVQLIMPELKNQERLILRRTLVQQSNERASTIFCWGSAPFNWGNQYYGQF
jgi:hypothetical protein